MGKIDAALGAGADTTIKTLQADFGISINHYILVDFQAFEGIVDRDRHRAGVLPARRHATRRAGWASCPAASS